MTRQEEIEDRLKILDEEINDYQRIIDDCENKSYPLIVEQEELEEELKLLKGEGEER